METAGRSLRSKEAKETGRLEAFSDGIFAFAITLLVLGLRDPATTPGADLAAGLLNEWPSFFAFFTSFSTILTMWVNHHNMFNFVRRIDTRFMFYNGLLLLWVTVTPFTTMLVADHLLGSNSSTAAEVYCGAFLLLAVTWGLVWRRARVGRRLLAADVTESQVEGVSRDYRFGLYGYVVAVGLSIFNGLAGIAVVLGLAAFFAYTATSRTLGD